MIETIVGLSMAVGRPQSLAEAYEVKVPQLASSFYSFDATSSVFFVQPEGRHFTLVTDQRGFDANAAARSAAIDRLNKTLETYKSFDEGWDGYSGQKPSAEAIHDARAFLSRTPIGIPLPRATLSSSGEILFYWKKGESYAEAGISGDGSYYYLVDGNDVRDGKEGLSIEAGFTEEFEKTLTRAVL